MGLPVAVGFEAIRCGIVEELAVVGEIAKACHRVCGHRHGDVATPVEFFDEGVAARIPAVEVTDDGDGPSIVDHERDQNVTVWEETGGDHR